MGPARRPDVPTVTLADAIVEVASQRLSSSHFVVVKVLGDRNVERVELQRIDERFQGVRGVPTRHNRIIFERRFSGRQQGVLPGGQVRGSFGADGYVCSTFATHLIEHVQTRERETPSLSTVSHVRDGGH
jgi:hypothetical protein